MLSNIIESLPSELIAIVLQYDCPIDEVRQQISEIDTVLTGPHRHSIDKAHTCIEHKIDIRGYKITTYLFQGKLHRIDGPAYIEYFYNGSGNVRYEGWFIDGEKHRTDGPACIKYDVLGNIEIEKWFNSVRKD